MKTLQNILICIFVAQIFGEGILVQAPPEVINPKVKSQLFNLIVKHPEELALDAKLFQVTMRHEYLNIVLIESIIDRIIQSMRSLDIESAPLRDLLFSQKGKQRVLSNVFRDFPTYEQYQLIKQNYASKIFEPISFIQECDCFARQKFNYRLEFEAQVLTYVRKNYPDKSQQLIVTEFASGEFFELLVLCTKLINAGYKNLRINCIDLKYKSIIDLYPIKDNTIFLKQFYPWSPEALKKLQTFILRALSEKRPPEGQAEEWERESEEVWTNYFNFVSYRAHQACVQFVQWLNNLSSTIKVVI